MANKQKNHWHVILANLIGESTDGVIWLVKTTIGDTTRYSAMIHSRESGLQDWTRLVAVCGGYRQDRHGNMILTNPDDAGMSSKLTDLTDTLVKVSIR